MPLLLTLRDSDFSSSIPAPSQFRERKASRAVVFDREGKVALFHVTEQHLHKLPGGALEEGEDIEAALRREVLEEIGCEIENVREVGMIEEYRNGNQFSPGNGLHQISYCYSADVKGEKGLPNLDESEIAEGSVTEWMDLDTAIETMESEKDIEDYKGKFIQKRDLIFLKEAKKIISNL